MDNNYQSCVLEYIEREKVAFQGKIFGSIHSYYLTNNPHDSLCDGFVRIYDSDKHYIEHEATFELLDSEIDTKHVVGISSRLQSLQDAGVVYPYFMSFSSKLNVWVICHERFKKYNFDNIGLYDQNIYLSVTWKRIIRDILCTLENLEKQGVSHGGLWVETNYVDVQGRVKLWNPKGGYIKKDLAVDLKDLAQLLNSHLRCHPGWQSFKAALRTDQLRVYDLLQHPFIVDVNMRIRIVYAIYEVGRNMGLSSHVLDAMSGYRGVYMWKTKIPMDQVYQEVLYFERADGNAVDYQYNSEGLIHYMRNLFEHGKISLSDAEIAMSSTFPNFLGAFFNAMKMNDENSQFLQA